MTTMALVPQVADAVRIPVIAAGGIADGRQLLAAFALGAVGVQLRTCLWSARCPIHDNYKQAVLKAKDSDTIVTGRIGGVPVRILKMPWPGICAAGKGEGGQNGAGAVYAGFPAPRRLRRGRAREA